MPPPSPLLMGGMGNQVLCGVISFVVPIQELERSARVEKDSGADSGVQLACGWVVWGRRLGAESSGLGW